MKAMRQAVLLALMLGTVLAAGAADRIGPDPSDVIHPRVGEVTAPGAGSSGSHIVPAPDASSMLPALGYLSVFAALALGVWYFVKKGTLSRPFKKSEGKLNVLETKVLGNRQFLIVAEYEDVRMLLGVCPGRIDYLTPLAPEMSGLTVSPQMEREESELPPVLAARFEGDR